MYWPLGLVVAAASVPIVWLSNRFERRYVLDLPPGPGPAGRPRHRGRGGRGRHPGHQDFGRGRSSSGRYDEAARTLYDTSMDKVRLSAKFWTFLEVIPNFAVAVVLLFGALGGRPRGPHARHPGGLHHPDAVPRLADRVARLHPRDGTGGDDRGRPDHGDLRHPASITSGATVLEQPRGHLRLEGVGFAFPDLPDELVLRDVHLEVVPGETVAIVGATGSGKTVLTSLVPRLYDVTAGRVTIDGVDVRDLDLASLRQVVATAFEEPTLFSMSARENLIWAGGDATEGEMRTTRSRSRRRSFVHDLPVGARHPDRRAGHVPLGRPAARPWPAGCSPSPRILVLDDTLSALDVHTEKLVEGALRRVLAGRDRHRRRAPRVDGAAGRQGRAAPGRHHHPRRRPQRAARDGPGLPRTLAAGRRRRGGLRMTGAHQRSGHRSGHRHRPASPPPVPPRTSPSGAASPPSTGSDDLTVVEVRPAAGPVPPAAGATCSGRTSGGPQDPARHHRDRERRASLDPLPRQGGHRQGHPADPGDR